MLVEQYHIGLGRNGLQDQFTLTLFLLRLTERLGVTQLRNNDHLQVHIMTQTVLIVANERIEFAIGSLSDQKQMNFHTY